MVTKDEEIAEGIKDAREDKKHKTTRDLARYTPNYCEGYLSIITKKTTKEIDESLEKIK